jgi:hypothetical protein
LVLKKNLLVSKKNGLLGLMVMKLREIATARQPTPNAARAKFSFCGTGIPLLFNRNQSYIPMSQEKKNIICGKRIPTSELAGKR